VISTEETGDVEGMERNKGGQEETTVQNRNRKGKAVDRIDDRMDKQKEWGKKYGGKLGTSSEGIEKKEGNGLKYERNSFLLNLNTLLS
jgi:hypothetical protein